MLYAAIEDDKLFKEENTSQFMREKLYEINYLHQQGIVHRDIKPENVLCTSKQRLFHVKIADFRFSTMCNVKYTTSKRMMMNNLIETPEFIASDKANLIHTVSRWICGHWGYYAIM